MHHHAKDMQVTFSAYCGGLYEFIEFIIVSMRFMSLARVGLNGEDAWRAGNQKGIPGIKGRLF